MDQDGGTGFLVIVGNYTFVAVVYTFPSVDEGFSIDVDDAHTFANQFDTRPQVLDIHG
jgi:hypothetical protein